MEFTRVTSKGQVVIPSNLRKKYGIKGGTWVRFVETNGEIHLIVSVTKKMIRENVGKISANGRLIKSLLEEKKFEREL